MFQIESRQRLRGSLCLRASKRAVSTAPAEIQFHVGQSYYLREFGDFKESPGSRPFFVQNEPVAKAAARPLKKYFEDSCSNSLKNGVIDGA